MQQHRRFRALSMIAKLKAAGLQIEESDVIEAAGSADSIGRPHIAEALVKRGYSPARYDALKKYARDLTEVARPKGCAPLFGPRTPRPGAHPGVRSGEGQG